GNACSGHQNRCQDFFESLRGVGHVLTNESCRACVRRRPIHRLYRKGNAVFSRYFLCLTFEIASLLVRLDHGTGALNHATHAAGLATVKFLSDKTWVTIPSGGPRNK